MKFTTIKQKLILQTILLAIILLISFFAVFVIESIYYLHLFYNYGYLLAYSFFATMFFTSITAIYFMRIKKENFNSLHRILKISIYVSLIIFLLLFICSVCEIIAEHWRDFTFFEGEFRKSLFGVDTGAYKTFNNFVKYAIFTDFIDYLPSLIYFVLIGLSVGVFKTNSKIEKIEKSATKSILKT